eukprot:gene10597-biopygen4789
MDHYLWGRPAGHLLWTTTFSHRERPLPCPTRLAGGCLQESMETDIKGIYSGRPVTWKIEVDVAYKERCGAIRTCAGQPESVLPVHSKMAYWADSRTEACTPYRPPLLGEMPGRRRPPLPRPPPPPHLAPLPQDTPMFYAVAADFCRLGMVPEKCLAIWGLSWGCGGPPPSAPAPCAHARAQLARTFPEMIIGGTTADA